METVEYDIKRDYYDILGVKPSARIDEIRSAHKALEYVDSNEYPSLKYHPDTAGNEDSKLHDTVFHDVSEAWYVLSRPDLKLIYDSRRSMAYQATISPSFQNPNVSIDFSYKQVSRPSTSSDGWKDRQSKYKTDSWKKLSHEEQKSYRRLPSRSVAGTILTPLLPFLMVGVVAYGYYRYDKYHHEQALQQRRR